MFIWTQQKQCKIIYGGGMPDIILKNFIINLDLCKSIETKDDEDDRYYSIKFKNCGKWFFNDKAMRDKVFNNILDILPCQII